MSPNSFLGRCSPNRLATEQKRSSDTQGTITNDVPWLWSLFGLLPFGVALTITYDHLSGRAEERRKLRREGSEVITPAKELVSQLGPEGILFGTDEEIDAYLRDCQKKWWEQLRPPLMVYLNQHPSERVRELGEEFALAVAKTIGSTRDLLAGRKTATTMAEHDAAARYKADALTKADELLKEIRRSRPRWLRVPKRG
jgi:hypothetical protein